MARSTRVAAITAQVIAVTAGVFLAAAVVFTAMAPRPLALAFLTFGLVVAPPAAVLGVLIVRRQPDNVVGTLLGLLGLVVAANVAMEAAWHVLASRPEAWESYSWLAAILNDSAAWVLVVIALLLLYFPDGRLPSRRWRWVPVTLVISATIGYAYEAFDTRPFGAPLADMPRPFGPAPTWLEVASLPAFVLWLALTLACAVSLVSRYRQSGRVQRSQITWLALAGIGIPLWPVLCLIEILLWGRPLWLSLAVGVGAMIGIPIATGIAVLRHDLYDVDKALAGTVTWALLTAALLGIYAVTLVAAGVLIGRGSAAAAAAATAVCAIALAPLRSRLQQAVDRRLYPLRRAAQLAIDTLHRATSADRTTPEQLESTLRTSLRDRGLRVGFRLPGTDRYVDAGGEAVDPTRGVPVEIGRQRIGVIVPASGLASAELVRQVAGWVATLVEVIRLRLELATALREVESSRARLVHFGYEERRRLERDLHDGAQQRLVSLGMELRLAQRRLGNGVVDVDRLLDGAVAELGTAVAELRQIAHGLRPSLLDDGLDAALSALVRTIPVPVRLHVDPAPVPDDVATTVYYVASEALANAVKHASAELVELGVTRADGNVVVRVRDDGTGGATLSNGSGLADRVAALGGQLTVESPRGHGTLIKAVLPCGS